MHLPILAPGFYAVFLEDLRLDVRIGILPSEKLAQPVSFQIAAIVQRISAGDGIEDVVDYNHLRDTVFEIVEAGPVGLQETLCEAIIERLFSRPSVHGVVVETRKLSVYDDAESVGCRMSNIAQEALARV
ncbi:MAG: dihydroneopterin aldolase [Pseudomonadota bacterium]